MPAHSMMHSDSPFGAASKLLASPFPMAGGSVVPHQPQGASLDASLADFMQNELVSPGMQAHMRSSLSPLGLAALMGPGGGTAGASPLLFEPSPFGAVGSGADGAQLRNAASSFGPTPAIIRRRSARTGGTPASALRGWRDAAADGAGAGGSAGTAAAVRAAQAHLAALAHGQQPFSAAALTASVMLGSGDGPSPLSSPIDMELARALFVSPSGHGFTPASSLRTRSAAGAAGVSPGPLGPPLQWGEAAAAPAGAAAAWQRGNTRVSEIFRRPSGRGAFVPPALAYQPASSAAVGPEDEAGALDALQVMRRVDSLPGGAGGDLAQAGRVSPLGLAGKHATPLRGISTAHASAALAGAMHQRSVADPSPAKRLRTASGAQGRLAKRADAAGRGGVSPYAPGGGGALEASSPEPTAADALIALTPSAYLTHRS